MAAIFKWRPGWGLRVEFRVREKEANPRDGWSQWGWNSKLHCGPLPSSLGLRSSDSSVAVVGRRDLEPSRTVTQPNKLNQKPWNERNDDFTRLPISPRGKRTISLLVRLKTECTILWHRRGKMVYINFAVVVSIMIIAVVVVVVVLLGWINVLAESSANNSKSLGSSRLNLSGRWYHQL